MVVDSRGLFPSNTRLSASPTAEVPTKTRSTPQSSSARVCSSFLRDAAGRPGEPLPVARGRSRVGSEHPGHRSSELVCSAHRGETRSLGGLVVVSFGGGLMRSTLVGGFFFEFWSSGPKKDHGRPYLSLEKEGSIFGTRCEQFVTET